MWDKEQGPWIRRCANTVITIELMGQVDPSSDFYGSYHLLCKEVVWAWGLCRVFPLSYTLRPASLLNGSWADRLEPLCGFNMA